MIGKLKVIAIGLVGLQLALEIINATPLSERFRMEDAGEMVFKSGSASPLPGRSSKQQLQRFRARRPPASELKSFRPFGGGDEGGLLPLFPEKAEQLGTVLNTLNAQEREEKPSLLLSLHHLRFDEADDGEHWPAGAEERKGKYFDWIKL